MYDRLEDSEKLKIIIDTDVNNNNLLFYAAKYNIKLLIKILDSKMVTKEIISHRNNNNETVYLWACKESGKSIQYLLNNEFTSNDLLYFGHLNHGSCLTLACKYQPIALKYLLAWNKLDWKVLDCLDGKLNFVQIAAIHNSICIKYAVESQFNLENYFSLGLSQPVIFLACRYQPDAVKYILDSKYASIDIYYVRINHKSCMDEALDCQPKALGYLLNSKLINKKILAQEDESGLKIIARIKIGNPDINTYEDILSINLLHINNIVALDDSDQNICTICYSFISNVIFNPCMHICCTACAFKLKKCHQCRSNIDNKKIIKN